MKKILILAVLIVLICAGIAYFVSKNNVPTSWLPSQTPVTQKPTSQKPVVKPSSVSALPLQKIIPNNYYAAQTFNNCAPVALSMALSYYGVHVSQEALADSLRPTHNLTGKNDDKSTTPDELGEEAKKYGLIPYFRADGDVEMLKKFIANDIPIVVRTLLKNDEDFAHYRVVKGYDDRTSEFIEDDGYEGKNLRFSYEYFLKIWQPFNHAYLILVPQSKKKIAEEIMGAETNALVSWENAVKMAEGELKQSSANIRARFNLSTALYYTGKYSRSAEEFEKVQSQLPMRALWYQIEPIQAYAKLGNYAQVFTLTDSILNNNNPAYSELYILRGEGYLKRGEREKARAEFEKAVFYNKNLLSAQKALASVPAN